MLKVILAFGRQFVQGGVGFDGYGISKFRISFRVFNGQIKDRFMTASTPNLSYQLIDEIMTMSFFRVPLYLVTTKSFDQMPWHNLFYRF